MSKIWSIMMGLAIIYAIITGESEKIVNLVTTGAMNSVENIFAFMGMLCFWSGIFNILKNTSLINKLSKIITPISRRIFKKDEVDDEILESIALNVTADALGAGNAATIYSVEAIKKMQKKNKNKDRLNDSMGMFVLLNTASIQIIPTTMISLRVVYGSDNPLAIIFPVWIVTFTALISGLFFMQILNKVIKMIDIIVPFFILIVIVSGFFSKKDILKLFTEGVSEGLKTVISIFPHILAITIAITLLRETGLITFLLKPIQRLIIKLGVSEGIVPLMLLRPISGSAATSIVMDIFKIYGPDSFEGKVASVIMGGTETTFYVLTILMGTVKIKKIRGVLIAALIADFTAMIVAVVVVKLGII